MLLLIQERPDLHFLDLLFMRFALGSVVNGSIIIFYDETVYN